MWMVKYHPNDGYRDSLVDTMRFRALAVAWTRRQDSLVLSGSRGFWSITTIEGQLHGDTLIGRIHASYDYGFGRDEPRANIFGAQYPCLAFARAREAAALVSRLALRDTPDLARDSFERSAREESIRAWLRRVGADR
jgi:hypothetical protein